jgi:tripeptidyl-peptidase-1
LPADISAFQQACGLPSHPLDKFKGKNDEAKCKGNKPSEDECMEAAMDAQIISSSATGCHTEFWNGGEGSFISLFQNINSAGDAAPRVFTFSFGDPETERDDDVKNVDKELAKIVAKGITLVCSSGDNGAGKQHSKYVTNYPASSPYVLSVGSTSLKTSGSIHGGEVAVKDGYSSGGFSSLFTAPAWQTSFTKAYLASGAKRPSSGFTKTGRGVPDISVLGSQWAIVYRGSDSKTNGVPWSSEDGTSNSSPFIASLIARLNAARLAKGQGTMGYMHQWLYSKVSASSGALYDVTEGSNNANGNSGSGFSATKGWDPVTGLGTPNFKLLEALALSGPQSIVV